MRHPLALLTLAACGAPANQGIEAVDLVFTPSSLLGDTVTDEAAVNPLTFLADVKDAVGHDLVGIELTSLTLEQSGNTGLSGWGDLFDSDTDIYFAGDHGDTVLASTFTPPSGFDTLALPILATHDDLTANADILVGAFTIRLEAKSGRNPEDVFSLQTVLGMTFVGE